MLGAIMSCVPDPMAPWRPHIGYILRVRRAPRVAIERVIRFPRSLVCSQGSQELNAHVMSWQETELDHRVSSFRGIAGKAVDAFSSCVMSFASDSADKVGAYFAKWSKRAEVLLASKVTDAASNSQHLFGRGQHAKIVLRPIMPKQPLHGALALDASTHFWEVIAALSLIHI